MRKRTPNNKDGSALLIAIVIMAVVTILTASLLLVSFSLFRTASRKQDLEQCRELARSVSRELHAELTDKTPGQANGEELRQLLEGNTYPMWSYLRMNLLQDNWPYYDAKDTGHSLTDTNVTHRFTLDEKNQEQAEIDELTVDLYWYWDPETAANPDPVLAVLVTCGIKNQTSSVTFYYTVNETTKTVGDIMVNSFYNPNNNLIRLDEQWTFSKRDQG